MAIRPWEADPSATFVRRIGKSALETGNTASSDGCPDIWQLSDGNYAIIGRDLTENYQGQLPEGVSIVADERLVVIPGNMMQAAKPDIPE